jgi:hypothetical protein
VIQRPELDPGLEAGGLPVGRIHGRDVERSGQSVVVRGPPLPLLYLLFQ